ncbi:MAG: protein phosphatase 2C domain-containing protein [Aridibacter sp.]
MAQYDFQINSAAVSDKGLSEKRPNNEDSYLELRDSGLFAVADGVGGAQAGDVASQMAMEILGEAFINLEENGDAEKRMKEALEQANAAIFQMSNDLAQLSTMATTVVALHINGNIATIGHVGDSRLYRLDSNGNLLQETQDHSVVEEEVQAGRLTAEQAATHPGRNIISRALGAENSVEIDMKTIIFEPDTTFLVCTDGITRHIPDQELKEILESENDIFNICHRLKTLCYERGAEDNLTAVLVKISKEANEIFSAESLYELDIEEETVATSRPPLVDSSVLSNATVDEKDSSDENLSEDTFTQPVQEGDVLTITDDADSFSIPTTENNESVEKDENVILTPNLESSTNDIGDDGITGKLISGLVWLLIGGLIGAGITYFWMNNQPRETASAFPTPHSEETSVSTFEQRRKSADENPTQFIAENVRPENSEDYYLIGRAYLRQGNFAGARSALESAKEKLTGNNDANAQVLAFEIAQGLAIINTPFAQTEFEKELGISKSGNSNSDINTNSNSDFNAPVVNSNSESQTSPQN